MIKNEKIDLNLFLVFDTIYRKKSITEAAYALQITQPAVSNALSRLRNLLGDQLFVRSSRSMAPTPLANRMAPEVRDALARFEAFVDRSDQFDPQNCSKTFRLALTDYGAATILPRLTDILNRKAPNVSLRIHRLEERNVSDALANGEVDLAFASGLSVKADIYAKHLFSDDFVVLVRKGHPDIQGSISMEAFCKLPHVLYTPHERKKGIVDKLLAERGLEHKTKIYTTHAYSIPEVIALTDYITVIPGKLAAAFSMGEEFQCLPAPLKLPEIDMMQFWHLRTLKEPMNGWLRGILDELFRCEAIDRMRRLSSVAG